MLQKEGMHVGKGRPVREGSEVQHMQYTTYNVKKWQCNGEPESQPGEARKGSNENKKKKR